MTMTMLGSGEFTEPRLLHSKGFIQLCIDKSGIDSTGSFLSTGTDGDIWMWTGDELDEAEYDPKNINERTHCAMAWHNDKVYIGHTSTNMQTSIQRATVSRFEKESLRMIAPITTFSLDITTIDVSNSGRFLAAGAIDHVLKIINLETEDVFRAEADGQIMCVSFDPNEEYLAVTATDGMLRVFTTSLPNDEIPKPVTVRICSRIIDIEPSNSRLQLCWSQSGNVLFVPALGCVKKFSRDSFNEIGKFSSPSNTYEMFSICCVSSCDTYLAASTMNGSICVWQIETGELLTYSKYQINGQPKIICTMFWHRLLPDTLFFADTEEHICSLSKCTRKVEERDDGNNIGLELREEKSKSTADLEDDENSRLSADLGAIKKSYGFDEEGHFCGNVDEGKKIPYSFTARELPPAYKPPIVPKTFVTASTPEHLTHRYLKWNRYGTVISLTSGEDTAIEINWHDRSIHPEIIVDNNTANFSIADITDEIAALGSKADGERLSELQVHSVKAWDYGSRQWNITLPEGESIENISIGKTFIVVATSQRYFRTFSHAGTQRIIFCYSGPLLTMCAFNDMFTAVMIKGGAYYENDEPQFDLVANIFKMNTEGWYKCQSLIQTVPINVSRGAKLDWIDYTNRGTLCTMDSKYCCRILSSNGIWIPIYNFASSLKTKSDHIFPISFMDYPQCEVRYLYCRGAPYPLVESRLLPLIVKWQLPLCNQDSEKSKLEEKLLLAEIRRCKLSTDGEIETEPESSDISMAYAKDVVRLFALACKADRQCRAAEFATYAHTSQVVQSMCNFASKTRHPLLAEKIAEVGRINAAQQNVRHEKHERKRNIQLHEKNENDFLAPKRLRKVDCQRMKSLSNGAPLKVTEKQQKQLDDECMEDQDSIMSTESSSIFIPFMKHSQPSNPFKRKSPDAVDSNSDGFFDSIASSSSAVSEKVNDDSGNWKKMKTETTKTGQTLLSDGSAEENSIGVSGKSDEKKTGFELWLKSVESNLRKEYDGDEKSFLKYATKLFRRLRIEDKKYWNGLARDSKIH